MSQNGFKPTFCESHIDQTHGRAHHSLGLDNYKQQEKSFINNYTLIC